MVVDFSISSGKTCTHQYRIDPQATASQKKRNGTVGFIADVPVFFHHQANIRHSRGKSQTAMI
jgi:hypothetical protein